jgi:hypothetical protein
MKNILLIIIIIIISLTILYSCSNDIKPNYTYNWKVAVVYTNGDKDTLNCKYDSFKGNECFLYLKISENGLLSSGGTASCIVMGCGFYTTVVACGVRKYEVLSLNKKPLKIK